ncbi:MAG TPA: hypothetical protein PLY86_17200 [bacterium]|nr:hypothetical protein [bacterium]
MKPTIVMIDAANGTKLLRTDPIREATHTYWPYLLGPDRDDTHSFGEDRIDFQYYFSGRADSPKAMEPEELPQAAAVFVIGEPPQSQEIFRRVRKKQRNAKVCAFHGLHFYEVIEFRRRLYPKEISIYEEADGILCARQSNTHMWKQIFPDKPTYWLPVPYPLSYIRSLFPAPHNPRRTFRVGFIVFCECEASFLTAYAIHKRLGDRFEFVFLNVPATYQSGKEPTPERMTERLLPGSVQDSWSSSLPFRHSIVSTWISFQDFIRHIHNCDLVIFADNKGHQGRVLMDCAALKIPCVCTDSTSCANRLWSDLSVPMTGILEKSL